MTDVPAEVPEEAIAEEVPPTEAPDPEEYAPTPTVSDDTGTAYEEVTGEPEATPQDVELDDAAPEE